MRALRQSEEPRRTLVTIPRSLLVALVVMLITGAGVLPRPCSGVAGVVAPDVVPVGGSVFGHPQADAALAALLAVRLDPAVPPAAEPVAAAPAAADKK